MFADPFAHDYLAAIFPVDPEVEQQLSFRAELQCAVQFEVALAKVEGELGIIPTSSAREIVQKLESFKPDISQIESGVARDGVYVPTLVKALRQHVGESHGAHVHFGATSQDVIDSVLMMRLVNIMAWLQSDLSALLDELASLDRKFGSHTLMGVTRLQDAVEMKVANRLDSWSSPLRRASKKLDALATSLPKIQFGGAVGTLDKLGEHGVRVRSALADALGLADVEGQWHAQRDEISDFGHLLTSICSSNGKIGQDFALMAFKNSGELTFSGGGGSSAMPHKQNPVKAEALVSLAHYCSVQMQGLYGAQIHEFERSGSAWTLEWMILPQLVKSASASLRTCRNMLSDITVLGR